MKRKNILKLIFVILIFFFGSLLIVDAFRLIGINPKAFDSKDMNYFDCFIELTYAVIIYLLYRNYFRIDFRELKSGFKKYFLEILKYFALFMVVKIASAALTSIVGFALGVEIGESENQNIIIGLTSSAPIMMLISTAILAPIVEEGIFRLGFRKVINNKYLFMIISGLVFGFLHIFPTELSMSIALTYSITYVTMGVLLAYVYVETDNIWFPIIIHALNNFISMLAIIMIGW